MLFSNKFLKRYEGVPAPWFTFSELECLQKDETLNPVERSEFKKIYNQAKFSIENNGADPYKIYATIGTESGKLAIGVSNEILIHGNNEVVITKEALSEIAFDISTPNYLSTHYKEALIRANKMLKKYKSDWHRIIFLRNVYTKRVHIYFD